jgi:hypothetical protein
VGVQSDITRGAIYCSTGYFQTGACLALRCAWFVCVACANDCRLVSPFTDLSSRVTTSVIVQSAMASLGIAFGSCSQA